MRSLNISKLNPSVNVLGVHFINETFNHFIHILEHRINHRLNTFVVTANPEIVMYARNHPKYQKIIHQANFITPDGIGIVKASHVLKHPLPDRISGYDIFTALLRWGNHTHKSVYFLGARPRVISDLIKIVRKRYPGIKIAGFQDGYFKNSQRITQDIKAQQPDMIFIALGYPKQELFIAHHRPIDNALWMGVGGSFDVLSGHVKRAPHFLIKHHLEWLYRLIKNPWRLHRMMSLPKFLITIYKHRD